MIIPNVTGFTGFNKNQLNEFLSNTPGYTTGLYTDYETSALAFRLQPDYTDHSPGIVSTIHTQKDSDGYQVPIELIAHTTTSTMYNHGSKLDNLVDMYIYKYYTPSSVSINVGNAGAVTYASMRSIDNLDERSMMLIYDDIWYCPDSYKYNTVDPITNYGARNIGHSQTYYMQRFAYRGYIADDIYYLDGGESIVGYGVYTINGEGTFIKINKNNLFIKI